MSDAGERLRERMIRFALIFMLMLNGRMALAAPAVPAAQSVEKLVKELGMHPASLSAIEFALPDTKGNMHTLGEFRGQWVLLTFWARWCPVCVRTMPHLENLHKELNKSGLKIVAISGDDGSDPVLRYAQNNKLSFLVLIDKNGNIARQYKATGIPSYYLISPNGYTVGIARGAINWDDKEHVAVMRKVLQSKFVPPAKTADSSTSEAVAGTAMTDLDKLAPPALAINLNRAMPRVNEWVTAEIKVRWTKDNTSSQYLIKVPKLQVPDGVTVGNASSVTDSVQGQAELTYRFPLKFSKPGDYEIGPIDLSYWTRGGDPTTEQTTRLAAIRVKVFKRALPWYVWLGGIVLGLALTGTLLAVYLRHKKKAHLQNVQKIDLVAQWSDLYKALRQDKWRGDMQKYCCGLIDIGTQMANGRQVLGSDLDLVNRMKAQREQIRFGGMLPTMDEVGALEKYIEKNLNEQTENT